MKRRLKKLLLIVSAIVTGLLILAGYSVPWTGFGDYTLPNGEFFRAKTLWDWLELLIIPLVLAGGALLLEQSERAVERKTAEDRAKLEREISTDRQQEAALQAYLDRMAEMLLEKELRTSQNEEMRNVARIRTLTVLRGLDETRKAIVLVFLYESGLIVGKPIVDLTEADLSGAKLSGTDLSKANLSKANLSKAHLTGANLSGAKLSGADLSYAQLSKADVSEADLFQASLIEADLSKAKLILANMRKTKLSAANLSGADLRAADLTGANLTALEEIHDGLSYTQTIYRSGADLSGADLSDANLKGAIMPDGTPYD